MPAQVLKEFLEANNVSYESIPHDLAYTSMEIAQQAHVPGRELAKTVIVDIDGHLAMAVLRATDQVDLGLLRSATGSGRVRLASESEFGSRFPSVEPGAMPPFGNLFEMEVFVDENLRRDEHIAFNAGTHVELIQLAYADFERLVQPVLARFTDPGSAL